MIKALLAVLYGIVVIPIVGVITLNIVVSLVSGLLAYFLVMFLLEERE